MVAPRIALILLGAVSAAAGVAGRLRPAAAKAVAPAAVTPAAKEAKTGGFSQKTSEAPTLSCAVELPRQGVPKGQEKDAMGFLDGLFGQYEEDVYEIPAADKQAIKAVSDKAGKEMMIQCGEDAYGEIPQESAIKLFQNPLVSLKKEEMFLDLGSGLGRLVVDAALFANVHRAVGVELSHARHNASCFALREVSAAMPVAGGGGWRAERHDSSVEMIEADILKIDRTLLHEADVVYLASYCFREDLLAKVQNVLEENLPHGGRIVSLKKFDMRKAHTSRIVPKGSLNLPMSWSVPGYAQALYVYDVKDVK